MGDDVLFQIHNHIRDLLVDLTEDIEGEMSDEDMEELVESMEEVTEMILDSLDIELIEVQKGRAVVSVRVPE